MFQQLGFSHHPSNDHCGISRLYTNDDLNSVLTEEPEIQARFDSLPEPDSLYYDTSHHQRSKKSVRFEDQEQLDFNVRKFPDTMSNLTPSRKKQAAAYGKKTLVGGKRSSKSPFNSKRSPFPKKSAKKGA